MSLLAVAPSAVPVPPAVLSLDGGGVPESLVLRAVSYLRVSTRGQAERAGEREGFSIPAQRQANRKTVHGLGAWVVKEFTDAGTSARTTERPALSGMLEWIRANRVDFVIVHKLDRLARNRADDVRITQAITAAGARVVSSTESIDDSPSGRLVHGIIASIAEFYSRNLATEVNKGMRQKAMNGGTPNRAPVGYRNVRVIDAQGREARLVELDEERAAIIRWAFTTYATGEWSLHRLVRGMTQLGFTLPPRAGKGNVPITVGTLRRLLRRSYYRGVVTHAGVEYPGAHEPLVDAALWQRVQDALTARRNTSTRQVRTHYLKGLLRCGECGSQMMFNRTKNKTGRMYLYFVCLGRHSGRTNCTLKAQQVHQVEDAVTALIARVSLTAARRRELQEELLEKAAVSTRGGDAARAALEEREAELREEQDRVLRAYCADAISIDTLKREQDRIRREHIQLAHELTVLGQQARHVATRIIDALDQLEDLAERFHDSDEPGRRAIAQALLTHIDVHPDASVNGSFRAPFDDLTAGSGTGCHGPMSTSSWGEVMGGADGDLAGVVPSPRGPQTTSGQ